MSGVKPLASLAALISLALVVPALSGCGASGGGELFEKINESEPETPNFVDGNGDGKGGGNGDPNDNGDGGDNVDTPNANNPLATGLSIAGINIYQAVGIGLMWDGAEVAKRNAPVVIGKDALVRVLVTPEADWKQREVIGRLELHDASGPIAAYESKLTVAAASKEETLNSTFNFDVPGSRITGDVRYKVLLLETSADAQHPGNAGRAQWPAEGTAQLGAQDSRGNFKFTIVPYRYNGRVPDTSEAHLKVFFDKFTAYPTPGVEISVHPVVDHSGTFSANGNGWNQLLNKTCNLRQSEGADRDNYYFGVIVPTASAFEFCGSGCVAGLAPLATNANDNGARCGIGLGFKDRDMAAETALHELGHALGREHAPCGLGGQQADRNYPYTNAGLGVWGWEPPKRQLKHPANVKDMMSYCSPIWISDYTYKALFDRISFVNSSALVKLPENFPEKWRSIVVEADGSVLWGDTVKLDSVPSGTPKTVYLLDENGKQIGEATGFFYGTHHLPGGWVVVPEEHLAGAKAVRLAGRDVLPL